MKRRKKKFTANSASAGQKTVPFVKAGPRLQSAIVAAAVLVGALSNMGPIGTNDIGFHLRLGQEIFETGGPPEVDNHSHTNPGAPYPDHEWLSQLGLYLSYRLFGEEGLAALQGLLVGACLALVALSVNGPAALKILLLLAVLVLGSEHSEIRPHLLGWVMTALLALLLEKRRKIPVLALLVFWANTHGSVLLGVGLAGLSLLEEAVAKRNWRTLAWAAAAAVAPLANPYTYHVYTLFFTIRGNASFVGEWRAYGLGTVQFWLVSAMAAASLVGILRKRPINWFDVARAGVLAALAFQSSRSGVVMAIFLAPSFGRWFGPYLERRPLFTGRVAASAALALVVAFLGWRIRSGRTLRFEVDREHLPAAAVEFAMKHGLKGPMFNDYNFGGYLLWKAWPKLPVFLDGRIEVYKGRVLSDYLAVSEARPGWLDVVSRYGIAFFMIRADRALTGALLRTNGWDLTYFDYNAAIFVRRDLFPQVRRLRIVSPLGHRDRSQVARAIEETRYLLGENPLFFGGHKILAFLLFRAGDFTGARASLKKYLELHPEGAQNEETRSFIEKLRQRGAWP